MLKQAIDGYIRNTIRSGGSSIYYILSILFKDLNSQVFPNTRAAAGWILFLSLVVFMYQFFTIFQLFVYLKLLYIKIPVGKSLWYLFPLIVSGVHTILCANVNNDVSCTTGSCYQHNMHNRILSSCHCLGCVLLSVDGTSHEYLSAE